MEMHEGIRTRRSIRSYREGDVPDQLIEKLLAAAMLAPSAGNQQPWHFIVIRDRKKLDAVPTFHPYCKMITQAPLAVVVCGDPEGKKWPGFWVQDCSAAIQNLLLSARAEGLGTVWTGVYPVEERIAGCRRLFNIPEHIIPLAIIPVGWPAKDSFRDMDRFNAALVHYDEFSG